jgi:1-acyl-sn-glycerol-3-phosphate acyltransferase
LFRSIGAVPIERGRAGLAGFKQVLGRLKVGEPMLVFPEGTRSADGRLRPFQPGFCTLARRSGATIVPVAIIGAFAAMPRGSIVPRPKPICLAFGRPITSHQYAGLTDEQLARLVVQHVLDAMETPPSAP